MFVRKNNPLWRASDRVEAGMLLGLFVLFLLGGPVLAWWAAGGAYDSATAEAMRDRRNAFQVSAELTSVPPSLTGEAAGGTAAPTPGTAQAKWIAPDGTRRAGEVGVAPTQRAGERMTIWVTRSGQQREAPSDHHPVAKAGLVAVVMIALAAAALNGTRKIGLILLDRHRAKAWQQEWLEVGPRWSRDLRS
ncbi:hypothetical protein GCM10010112_50150 [Actinoplanes lobatus]|uniref:Transmembrane protein n=1 Tax=Actinoplanes lobatus TaxID=113568 RepID=A0A7W7HPA9_9ACTN|nr:hypothetical protein [Actinoplanes lobatus]MBB4754175.1 hypothetical protein [Actinoplanes lobatus]GGN77236.1 hypothetical protein GCM10010112_50150 [Actinoplanes lobatus]GIE40771.1 hypothetical protein Alo02nite_36690 [Actinoplanes lobatus]